MAHERPALYGLRSILPSPSARLAAPTVFRMVFR
jgi:hypothetical protein